MRFAQVMTWKSNVPEELRAEWIKKRLEWKPPEGVSVLAEYLLPAAGNKVVMIYEGGDLSSLIAMRAPWMKYYDVDVYPTVPMEELLEAAPRLLRALE